MEDANIISSAGEANYFITKLLQSYLSRIGKNYKNINEIIGILECCKLEFYRRLVADYETDKAISNGDVFCGFMRKENKIGGD